MSVFEAKGSLLDFFAGQEMFSGLKKETDYSNKVTKCYCIITIYNKNGKNRKPVFVI